MVKWRRFARLVLGFSTYMGAVEVDAGTSVVLTFDDFKARRFPYIGLLPDPGIADPEPVAEPGWMSNLYAYDGAQLYAVTAVDRDDGQGRQIV